MLKTTRYFDEQVRRKRPYIELGWCAAVLTSPLRKEAQADGRIRFWGRVGAGSIAGEHVLRVITLEDGETVHNAFFDRNFHEESL